MIARDGHKRSKRNKTEPVLIPIRLRLVIFPALVVLAAMAGVAAFETRDAQSRVLAETASGAQLGRLLIQNALARAEEMHDPKAVISRLRIELPPVLRHVSIRVVDETGGIERPPAVSQVKLTAPAWFRRLVDAPPLTETDPIVVDGYQVGKIVLSATPEDEIEEVWAAWRSEMILMAVVFAAVIVVVLASLNLAMKPLKELSEGLDQLEAGDFAARVPNASDPMLKRLMGRFNKLAASLEHANEDNRLLINRLMSLQESERKEIAAELHDEIGPSLFAIRADLGALSRWTRKPAADAGEARERLTSISTLITQIQRINTRLLERLRPVVLDQMPLSQALQKLVEDYRARYPEVEWRAQIDKGVRLSDARALAVYLAAQEAMTNIIRHAGAKHADISFEKSRGAIRLIVSDDGRGMPASRRPGFGLLGMMERARNLGGALRLSASTEGGVEVILDMPTGGQP